MKKFVAIITTGILLSMSPIVHVAAQDTKKKVTKEETKKENEEDADNQQGDDEASNTVHIDKHKKGGNTYFGIEGGLNFSGLTIQNVNSTSKTGIRAGALAEFHLSDRLHIQPGVYYAMNGASDIFFTYSTGTYKMRINTVEVPVDLIYKFGKTGKNHIFIGLGLCYGYNFSGTINPGGTKLNIGSENTDVITTSNISLNLNAGYEMSNGLFFRLNYLSGLKNLEPANFGPSIYSSGIALQVGYFLAYKKK